jgi:excisionase family DNA binding protein
MNQNSKRYLQEDRPMAWMTTQEAAKALNFSVATIKRMIQRGELEAQRDRGVNGRSGAWKVNVPEGGLPLTSAQVPLSSAHGKTSAHKNETSAHPFQDVAERNERKSKGVLQIEEATGNPRRLTQHERELVKLLKHPGLWGHAYLKNRDGSLRIYWPHQFDDLVCGSRNIIHLDGRDVNPLTLALLRHLDKHSIVCFNDRDAEERRFVPLAFDGNHGCFAAADRPSGRHFPAETFFHGRNFQ